MEAANDLSQLNKARDFFHFNIQSSNFDFKIDTSTSQDELAKNELSSVINKVSQSKAMDELR